VAVEQQESSSDIRDGDAVVGRLQVGLSNRMAVGVLVSEPSEGAPNANYRMQGAEFSLRWPGALVEGMYGQFRDNDGSGKVTTSQAAVSLRTCVLQPRNERGLGMALAVGGVALRIRDENGAVSTSDTIRPFVGVAMSLGRLGLSGIVRQCDASIDASTPVNAGATYALSPRLAAEAGYGNLRWGTVGDNRFRWSGGMSYTVSLSRKRPEAEALPALPDPPTPDPSGYQPPLPPGPLPFPIPLHLPEVTGNDAGPHDVDVIK
jgi:hypothetical protein